MYDGFTREVIPVVEAEIALVRGGSGSPVLLLHGFPQTRAAWHRVAPRLASRFEVIVPDLPGYGDSIGPPPDDRHEHYSKRSMARMLVQAMQALGHARFGVAGHDRGARVAYRMALDHPDSVRRLAILEIVPTLEMADQLTYDLARQMANWFVLGQPAPVPETLIGHAPDFYLEHILDGWSGDPNAITGEARAEYARCFRNPGVIRSICEEYRAGFGPDLEYDRADRSSERRIVSPVLLLWARAGLVATFFDPLATWQRWADDVSGRALDCGHFLMEEAPEEVSASLERFFAA